jgi:hypothetical protein
MIVSRNEIESLALKAARGAGLSWGLAEEAAAAATWLAERDLPWAETLAELLVRRQATCPPAISGQVVAPFRTGSRLCPILTGALLSDLGPSNRSMEVHDLLGPLWLAPFLARWWGRGLAARLAWAQVSLVVGPHSLWGLPTPPVDGLAAPFASRVEIAMVAASAPAHPQPERRHGYLLPDDALRALQALEQRTYVPASAHSRLSGAGAGLLDND